MWHRYIQRVVEARGLRRGLIGAKEASGIPRGGELFTPPKPAGPRWGFRRIRGYWGVADRHGHPPGGNDPRVGLAEAPVICPPRGPARGSPSHRLYVVSRREWRRRKSIEVGSRRGRRPRGACRSVDLEEAASAGILDEVASIPRCRGQALVATGSGRSPAKGPADGTLNPHGKGSDGAGRERSQLPIGPGCAVPAVGSVRGQGHAGLGCRGGPPEGSPRRNRLRADEDGELWAPRNPRLKRDHGRSGRRRAPRRPSVGGVARHRFS